MWRNQLSGTGAWQRWMVLFTAVAMITACEAGDGEELAGSGSGDATQSTGGDTSTSGGGTGTGQDATSGTQDGAGPETTEPGDVAEVTPCTEGEILACDGESCVDGVLFGDGSCDTSLDCEERQFDGGDCVDPIEECDADLEVAGCEPGSCISKDWLGDGACDEEANCEALDFDGGDCVTVDPCGDGACDPQAGETATSCPEDCEEEGGCDALTEVDGCEVDTCFPMDWLGDGACDEEANCEALDFDGGDCVSDCPEGEIEVCDGSGCLPEDWLGDTICDEELNCDAYGDDAGDCAPAECQEDTELQSCDTMSCVDIAALANGHCDAELACDLYENDGGDCDPVECPATEVLACDMLSCLDAALLGDGTCDPELDCLETELDGGDCAPVTECGDGFCDMGETCSSCPGDCGECIEGSTCCVGGTGSGGCDDPACEAMVCGIDSYCCDSNWDTWCVACAKGGPGFNGLDCSATAEPCAFCHTCGDGVCDAAMGDTCDNCPEDCPICACAAGQVNGCDGSCVYESSIGNGICEEALNCDEFGADGGDCLECPEGEIASCIGTCMDESRLGDGTCDVDLQCSKWNWDEGDCEALCEADQVADCTGGCLPATWPGDGFCDSGLNCEAWNYDEGDCPLPCDEGQDYDCFGACQDTALLGDGTCNDFFQCQSLDWDGGDCDVVCSEGYIPNCNDGCTIASWIGDSICDTSLNCEMFNWDEGDCPIPCPEGQMWDCNNGCIDEALLGDGTCQPELACQATGWDSLDCEPQCAEGQVVNCDLGCTSDWWPGDGICDTVLNCAEWGYDSEMGTCSDTGEACYAAEPCAGGAECLNADGLPVEPEPDCVVPVCGDEACTADESFETCPDDCDPPPECGNLICEAGEETECPDDCAPTVVCGDEACDEGEDYMNCPDDCEAPIVCGDGLCEEGETEENCFEDCFVSEPCADVTFEYVGMAGEVLLSGTFNDWADTAETATVMEQTAGGVWTATVGLTGGVHQYKFIVDGTWTQDTNNPLEVPDGMDTGMNSVLYVSCGQTIGIAGMWDSNGGFTADISNEAFVQDYNDGSDPVSHGIVLYDNDVKAAIVQSSWDQTYEVIVWTDFADDGSWYYCQAVTGQASVLEAFEAEGVADAADPTAGGCGEANFAWNLMTPSVAPEPTICESYCDLAESTCIDENALEYADVDCLTACATWVEGELVYDDDETLVGPVDGDTVACRIYHLNAAAAPDLGGPDVHCPHAAHHGGGVCVDTVPEPPTMCDTYCDLQAATCIDENALEFADVDCLTACGTWDEGELVYDDADVLVGPADGDTVACRIYHLNAAAAPDLGGPDVHCEHAAHHGGGVCVAPE